ncbi:MAG: conjugal transfer protein TrbI, partial [Cyanobacteria bacterium J06573_2]
IPRGSELVGQLEPATFRGEKGSQFVARELVFPDGRKQNIDATSAVVTNKETIKRGASTGKILTDAAYGTAAASVIALITGNNKIETLEPIAGAAAGAIAGILLRRRSVEVVVINPQNDLDVTLRSNLSLSRF